MNDHLVFHFVSDLYEAIANRTKINLGIYFLMEKVHFFVILKQLSSTQYTILQRNASDESIHNAQWHFTALPLPLTKLFSKYMGIFIDNCLHFWFSVVISVISV